MRLLMGQDKSEVSDICFGCSFLEIKKETVDWVDISVGRALAAQAWGPELKSQDLLESTLL